jgi:hypothetical protein
VTSTRVSLVRGLAVGAAAAIAAVSGVGLSAPAAQTSSQIFGIPLVVPCVFSHRSHDDPIVYPKQKGRSHNHTFFGNRSADAHSTLASLRGKRATTCGLPTDASAYWTPTLYIGKRAVVPTHVVTTYTRRTSAPTKPFPAGLKMIVGDAGATSSQSTDHVYWTCVATPERRWSTIPSCASTRRGLQLIVQFPDCWDGKRLDSSDHSIHMAYSSGGTCPGSHPVAVPTLALEITYPVTGAKATTSAGRFGAHADFFNAWDQATFTGLVDRYFNGKA